MKNEIGYLSLLKRVMESGEKRKDRTGVGTISSFGAQVSYDLDIFPLLTTKRIWFRGVIEELLWFLSGDTNSRTLEDKGVNIWSHWAGPDGDLGPVYGRQWKSWGGRGIDQIQQVIENIKKNPFSRRHVVSAWNVEDIPKMALPPCHILFQFYVTKDGFLDCQLYQRSADLFLGVPFNVASYSLLTYMIAQVTQLKPGRFIHSIGDAHIYSSHLDVVKSQLSREPKTFPSLSLNPSVKDIESFQIQDVFLKGYNPHPTLKAPIAV